jgi:hypothetical protein
MLYQKNEENQATANDTTNISLSIHQAPTISEIPEKDISMAPEEGVILEEDIDAGKSKTYKRLKEEFKTLFDIDDDLEDEQVEKRAKGMSIQIHPEYIEQVKSE